jgi:hypothetical protein
MKISPSRKTKCGDLKRNTPINLACHSRRKTKPAANRSFSDPSSSLDNFTEVFKGTTPQKLGIYSPFFLIYDIIITDFGLDDG